MPGYVFCKHKENISCRVFIKSRKIKQKLHLINKIILHKKTQIIFSVVGTCCLIVDRLENHISAGFPSSRVRDGVNA